MQQQSRFQLHKCVDLLLFLKIIFITLMSFWSFIILHYWLDKTSTVRSSTKQKTNKKNWLINGENNEQIKSLFKLTFYKYMIWNGSSLQKPAADCSCHLSSSMFLVSVGKQSELHDTLNDSGWTTSVISSGVLSWPWTPGQMCVKWFLRESGDVWWFSNSTGGSVFVGVCDNGLICVQMCVFIASFAPLPYFVLEKWKSSWDCFLRLSSEH